MSNLEKNTYITGYAKESNDTTIPIIKTQLFLAPSIRVAYEHYTRWLVKREFKELLNVISMSESANSLNKGQVGIIVTYTE